MEAQCLIDDAVEVVQILEFRRCYPFEKVDLRGDFVG
jgi:hypothetical protein